MKENLRKRIESYEEEMIRDLRRLLKHNSVAGEPSGEAYNGKAVDLCLDDALKMAEEMGFETGRVGSYAGYAAYGEGEPYVAVLGHLDIVPAGSDWKHDPFAGEIEDGKIYGRGTADDKGPLVAALYGLKALKDEGIMPGSKVMVVMGTSEETGGPDIEKFVEKFGHPKAGFTPDADFPVINAEKNIIRAGIKKEIRPSSIEIEELSGGNAPNMVPDSARLVYVRDGQREEMVLKGKSAHGSMPHKGDNAIFKLLKTMEGLDTELDDEVRFLYDILSDTTGAKAGIGLEDEPSGKLTMNTGMIRYQDGILSLVIDIREPVTFEKEDVERPLREKLKKMGYELSIDSFTPKLYYPKDEPLVETLMNVYRDITGDKSSEPLAIGGGTYAKAMNNVVAFGANFPGRDDVAHIADEYLMIEDFIKSSKIYSEAILGLSRL